MGPRQSKKVERKLYYNDAFSKGKKIAFTTPHSDRLPLLFLNDDADLEVRAKVNKLIANQFPGKDLFSSQFQYCDEDNENSKNKLKDTFMKIKQFRERDKTSKKRLNSIPKNATIREEFIKCGKDAL